MTNETVIPKEAVEAVARLCWQESFPDRPWPGPGDPMVDTDLEDAWQTVQAAAPFIAAKAVEHGNDEHTRLVKRGNEQQARAVKAEHERDQAIEQERERLRAVLNELINAEVECGFHHRAGSTSRTRHALRAKGIEAARAALDDQDGDDHAR